MSVPKNYYQHLNKEKNIVLGNGNLTVQTTVPTIVEALLNSNYGVHRALSLLHDHVLAQIEATNYTNKIRFYQALADKLLEVIERWEY